MLAEAERKGVYRSLVEARLGERLPYEDATYDAVVSSGVLTTGHAPASSLDELVRVTRPGGHVVFTLRSDRTPPGYDAKLAGLVGGGPLGARRARRRVPGDADERAGRPRPRLGVPRQLATRSSQRSKSARPAARISSALSSMAPRNAGRAFGAERPLERRHVLRNPGPLACHLGRHLEVELHAVRALEAERLVRVGGRSSASRTAPSGRSNVSPCHCSVSELVRRIPRTPDPPEPRPVMLTGRSPTSGSGPGIDPRSERGRQQLHAETDAPVRRPRAHGVADRTLLLRQPGEGRVVVDGHRTAHRHDRVEPAPVGERITLVELDSVQLDATLVQHVLEDARRLARDVLEDERTHALVPGRLLPALEDGRCVVRADRLRALDPRAELGLRELRVALLELDPVRVARLSGASRAPCARSRPPGPPGWGSRSSGRRSSSGRTPPACRPPRGARCPRAS